MSAGFCLWDMHKSIAAITVCPKVGTGLPCAPQGCYTPNMTGSLALSPTRRLAFHKVDGKGPTVVFLGGYKSDMTGTKALALQDWAVAGGRAFLRFDYSGHGQSSGLFEDGCIGDWRDDAAAMIAAQTKGPIVLVGSSMGGWISLLLAREMPERVAGVIGLAAAPDFTDDIWEAMTPVQRDTMLRKGQIAEPSEYGAPYIYTRRLIEDGRLQRIFDQPLNLPFPVRCLQGTADTSVPVATALRLLDHATGPDIRLTLIKGADHRLSTPDCLELLRSSVQDVIERAENIGE
jgi:pimeloyl-ACP methyl ester carboxylesterase